MSEVKRIIFDTSTLVGAAIRVGSVPHQALQRTWAIGKLYRCKSTLDELEEVLGRSKFDRLQIPSARQEFLEIYRTQTYDFELSESAELSVYPSCRDPKDNKFLALANACGATVIVSSDADLLVLNPWLGVKILSPAEFVELVS